MNSLKKIVELASMRMLFSQREMKSGITRKEWVDFCLVLVISFLIVVYKVGKAS
jgi:hypothetical protein